MMKKIGTTTTETYSYDLLNRMISSTVSGVSATYTYRTDGLRYSKTSGGIATVHIWDGANILGDVANGVVSATYVRGIGLIASKIGGAFTYYMYNGHGDVVQLVNSGGTAITKSYDYDAFGVEKGQTLYGDVNGDGKVNISDSILLSQYLGGQNVIINMKESDVSGNGVVDQADSQRLGQYIAEIVVTLGPSPIDSTNPFRYCGEYFDKETGTIYLRARYYSPKTARFMTEDSFKGFVNNSLSLNLYTYCYNNPIRYFDPSGHVSQGDQTYISDAGLKIIAKATTEYYEATTDAGRAAAHAKAQAVRDNARKTGGQYARITSNSSKTSFEYILAASASSALINKDGPLTANDWAIIVSNNVFASGNSNVFNAMVNSIEVEVSFGVGVGGHAKIGAIEGKAEGILIKQTHSWTNDGYNQRNQAVLEISADLMNTVGVKAGINYGLTGNNKNGINAPNFEAKLGGYAGNAFFGFGYAGKNVDLKIGVGVGVYVIVGWDVEINFNVSEFMRQMEW